VTILLLIDSLKRSQSDVRSIMMVVAGTAACSSKHKSMQLMTADVVVLNKQMVVLMLMSWYK
jgi:hypothetical protein